MGKKKSFSLFLFQLNIFYFANQEIMTAHLTGQILSFIVSVNWVKTALNLAREKDLHGHTNLMQKPEEKERGWQISITCTPYPRLVLWYTAKHCALNQMW